MNGAERGIKELLHPRTRERALGVSEEGDKELRLTKAAKEMGQQIVPHTIAPSAEVPPADHLG